MEKEYLLREKPLRAIWLFALPMMAGNLFQQFYTMADSMIVGRFVGEEALAAIGASYALTNVFICIAIGGGVGGLVGVLLSVPVVSVLYALLRRDVHKRLACKE